MRTRAKDIGRHFGSESVKPKAKKNERGGQIVYAILKIK